MTTKTRITPYTQRILDQAALRGLTIAEHYPYDGKVEFEVHGNGWHGVIVVDQLTGATNRGEFEGPDLAHHYPAGARQTLALIGGMVIDEAGHAVS